MNYYFEVCIQQPCDITRISDARSKMFFILHLPICACGHVVISVYGGMPEVENNRKI